MNDESVGRLRAISLVLALVSVVSSACDWSRDERSALDRRALAPTPPGADGKWGPPRTFQSDPIEQARVDAEAALASGQVVRIHYGQPPLDLVDPATGLRYAIYGCEVDDNVTSYAEAYNAFIDEAVARGRLVLPVKSPR